MREIFIKHFDYDRISKEQWASYQPGLLLNPYLVVACDAMGINYLQFSEPIGDEQQEVNGRLTNVIQLEFACMNSNKRFPDIDIAELASMTLVELGELLAAHIK